MGEAIRSGVAPVLASGDRAIGWPCNFTPGFGEGMILIFRHSESPYRKVEVALHGVKPDRN